MDCCKETKYNLLLKFNSEQKTDKEFLKTISNNLQEIMGYSSEQSNSVVEFATLREHFVLNRETRDVITKMSLKLAQAKIPHEVKLSKK